MSATLNSADAEYRPFPAKQGRNTRQERLELPLMVHLLGLPERCRILEVGCGAGVALPPISRLCRPTLLVGLDIDGSGLAQAAARLRNECTPAVLVRADVRRLPFPDGMFEVVVDFGTCYHIARPGEALREIARVLTQAGVFATETGLSQLLSHPIRSAFRRLPWAAVPEFTRTRHRLLWTTHGKRQFPRSAKREM